jgi:hypothetical protein
MMKLTGALLFTLGVLVAPSTAEGVLAVLAVPSASEAVWQTLDKGLELGRFKSGFPTIAGDSTVVVLRMDPALWDLRVICAGATGNLTAREWSQRERLTAVINAGMFAADQSTHVGYLRDGGQVNCASVNSYQSIAAFGPRREGVPRFRIHDLDEPGVSITSIGRDYTCILQNLRLVKRPGRNRWAQDERTWSEAALGEDSRGRILFIFCRSPYSMHDLNGVLASLPIDLVCAQHLEGGPEAQLYVKTDAFELEEVGSYETGFSPGDGNSTAWPVPNVLGIAGRQGVR